MTSVTLNYEQTFCILSHMHTPQTAICIECVSNSNSAIDAPNYGTGSQHSLPRTGTHFFTSVCNLLGSLTCRCCQCMSCLVRISALTLPVYVPACCDSSVSIVTRLWGGWYWVPILAGTRGFISSVTSTPALGHGQPSIEGVYEVKSKWKCTTTPLVWLHGIDRNNYFNIAGISAKWYPVH
jgi:hypothetical protein